MTDLPRHLFRNLALGAVLSLGLAAPQAARADGNDTAAIIGGLIALGVIAKALDDDDDRHVARQYRHDPRFGRDDRYVDDRDWRRSGRPYRDGWVWDDHRQRWVPDDFSPNH